MERRRPRDRHHSRCADVPKSMGCPGWYDKHRPCWLGLRRRILVRGKEAAVAKQDSGHSKSWVVVAQFSAIGGKPKEVCVELYRVGQSGEYRSHRDQPLILGAFVICRTGYTHVWKEKSYLHVEGVRLCYSQRSVGGEYSLLPGKFPE